MFVLKNKCKKINHKFLLYFNFHRFLPETNQPISNHQDKWVTLDKNFVTILVTNHSHITSSTVMYPDAHISDPYLTLLILHENTTRLVYTNCFMNRFL